MPTTSNASQALPGSVTAENDMTFLAPGIWTLTGNLHTARDIQYGDIVTERAGPCRRGS
jgi:hypothetical protein